MWSNNMFPNFIDGNNNGNSRQPASPSPSGPMNGNNATSSFMAPLPVGHQQDLNFLYAQLQELSGILRGNREKVAVLTKTAEEVAQRATNGHVTGDHDGHSKDTDAARIRSLEPALAKANQRIDLYKHEQTENTKLIADYEDAIGTATEQIRNYCCDNNDRYLAQRRHYNSLLQAEKDEHLQSRLDRDYWQAQTMKVCEMIRTAYRLRCDEWGEELAVISGLQNQVRALRHALGMEKERAEDETGWPYLKDAPLNLDGIDET